MIFSPESDSSSLIQEWQRATAHARYLRRRMKRELAGWTACDTGEDLTILMPKIGICPSCGSGFIDIIFGATLDNAQDKPAIYRLIHEADCAASADELTESDRRFKEILKYHANRKRK